MFYAFREPTGRAGEWKVVLPSFAAWQIGVVFFDPAGTGPTKP